MGQRITTAAPWNPKDRQYGFAYRDSVMYVFLLDNFTGKTLTLPALNSGQRATDVKEVGIDSKVSFSQDMSRRVTIQVSAANNNIRIIAVKLNKPVINK